MRVAFGFLYLKYNSLTEEIQTLASMTEPQTTQQPFTTRMASCCTACCYWWWTNGVTETDTPAVASKRLEEEEAPGPVAVAVPDKVPVPETVIPVASVPVAKVLVVEQDDDHEWDDTMY